MTDDKPARRLAGAALRGLVDGVGHEVTDRVRKEVGATRAAGDGNPVHIAQRAAAAAVGGAVGGVGQNVSALLREELSAVRDEAVASARTAARGAGLLGGAAAAGNTASIFVGIAVWRGLGNRIGFAKSALVVAGLAGTVAAVLASRGAEELGRMRGGAPATPSPATSPAATPPTAPPPNPAIPGAIVPVVPPKPAPPAAPPT